MTISRRQLGTSDKAGTEVVYQDRNGATWRARTVSDVRFDHLLADFVVSLDLFDSPVFAIKCAVQEDA